MLWLTTMLKEAAQAALDRGETVEFEAVETRKEVEEVPEPEAPASAPVETEEEKYNRSLKRHVQVLVHV